MKAEVTAENRPAYGPSEHVRTWGIYETHENEGGIEILLILLHELLVVLLSLLAVVPIEFRPRIFVIGRQVCRLPAVWVSVAFQLRTKENLPIRPLSIIQSSTLILHPSFFYVLTVFGDQKWEINQLWE